MKVIIIMGVAGCGKTTIGKNVASKLSIPFFDADDFHSKQNIDKMTSGVALTDADRAPWLTTLANKIVEWSEGGGAVLACSALKETYRQQLMKPSAGQLNWVYLKAEIEIIKDRLAQRKNHFFNPNILETQFRDLEPPQYGFVVSIDKAPDLIVEEILSYFNKSH